LEKLNEESRIENHRSVETDIKDKVMNLTWLSWKEVQWWQFMVWMMNFGCHSWLA